jgi:hypothetical protein
MKTAREQLDARRDLLELPAGWRKLLPIFPTTDGDALKNHKGSHLARLVQVFPFLLRGWLTEQHFTPENRVRFAANMGPDWVNKLVHTFVALSLSCREAFLESRPSGHARAQVLHDNVVASRAGLVAAWPEEFGERSNTHNGLHMVMAHLNFACRCIDARRCETAHGRNRLISTRHSNHREPEVDMMKAYGVQFILKFIATGNAYKHSDDGHPPGPELVKTLREDPFVRLILKKNEEADTYAGPVDCSTGEELETNRLPRSGEQRVLQTEELQLLVTAYETVHPE